MHQHSADTDLDHSRALKYAHPGLHVAAMLNLHALIPAFLRLPAKLMSIYCANLAALESGPLCGLLDLLADRIRE